MNEEVMVTVIMITYNHEKYIEQAIKGVLMQQCQFNFELIVANDNSTDLSDEIIQRTITNHIKSGVVNYIKRETNVGMALNFIDSFKKSKGKYIALCEGDDYWTEPSKLQMQVDFLEANEEFSMVCHDAEIIDEVLGTTYLDFASKNPKQICNTLDLFGSNFCTTASMLFRKRAISSFAYPDFKVLSGDLFMKLLISLDGMLYRMYEVMSIHRVTSTGATVNNKRDMQDLIKSRIILFNHFDKVSKKKFKKYIRIETLLMESYLDYLNSKSFIKTSMIKIYRKALFLKRKKIFSN